MIARIRGKPVPDLRLTTTPAPDGHAIGEAVPVKALQG